MRQVRGALVSLKEGMIVLGILLGYVVGFAMRRVPGGWRVTYGCSVLPALGLFLGMLRLPAAPRWLLRRGALHEAKAAVAFVYDDPAAAARVFQGIQVQQQP